MSEVEEKPHASGDESSDDEDFCPEKEAAGDSLSEEDSDDEASEEEQEEDHKAKKPHTRKTKTKQKQAEKGGETSRRSTRQMADTNGHDKSVTLDKDDLESDDEEKSRSASLWADFLSDVKPAAAKKSIDTPNTNTAATIATASSSKTADAATNGAKSPITEATPKQITITEIVDFAGEEVRVQKTVSADSIKENKATERKTVGPPRSLLAGGLKRPGAAGGSGSGSSGLGSILNQIGKKKKISVLEKTKLDWNNFKQDEGLEEELQTFNKGKDGYLERQDFLQRTDLRQFEIEKNLRQTRRN